MIDRPRIPQKTADRLMFTNDHTCCICRVKGKHVQIHHIDGNNSNNDHRNLVVLCLDCHSKVTANEGFGRSYTVGEVKQYKRTWELMVRKILVGEELNTQPQKEGVSYFDLAACEILAMEDGDPRIREKLETLSNINILVGCTDEILDTFFHLAIQSSMFQKLTATMLTNYVYELFPHLIGPDKVPISPDDKRRLEQGVKLLGIIGEFNGEFSKDLEVIQAACDNLLNMFEMIVLYNLKKIGALIVATLQKTKEACLIAYEDREQPLEQGAQYAHQTIQKIYELAQQRNINWKSLRAKQTTKI